MKVPLRSAAAALAGVEIWPVAGATAASMFVSRLLPFALALAVFFWIVRWAAYGRLTVRTPLDLAIVLLGLCLPVTLWASAFPEITLPQVYRLATGILLFYAIVNWTVTPARLHLLAAGLVGLGLLLSFTAPFSVQWAAGKIPFVPGEFYDRFVLLVSDATNPNVLAGYIAILIPIPAALLLFSWADGSSLERLLVVAGVSCMAAVLILTQSRGAWLASTAALFVLAVLRWRAARLLTPVILLGVVLLFPLMGPERVIDLAVSHNTLGGIEGRAEIWSRALYLIQDFPFTGIGMGTFGQVVDLLYPLFIHSSAPIDHAHNLFLQVAVDLGVFGLIAWIAVLGVVSFTAFQVFRSAIAEKNDWIIGLSVGLLTSQVALVVHGITDAVTWGMVRTAPLVWVLWGVGIAVSLACRPVEKPVLVLETVSSA